MINPELLHLKILLNKDHYNKYKEYLDFKYLEEYHREISFLYKALEKLHASHDKSFSLEEFAAFFWATFPDAKQEIYSSLFKQLSEASVDEEVGGAILDTIVAKKRAIKLSETAFQVAQGVKTWDDLKLLFDEAPKTVQDLPLNNVTDDLEELIEQSYQRPGVRWRLDFLNKSIGSLRPGDFGFIFARPETGKTTFLASESTCFLEQTDTPIVWFNNEEQGSKVMLRVYQAFFGITLEQLLASPRRFKDEFIARTKGKFRLFDSATISRRDVETIVKQIGPGVVIYDQIDKIRGFANDREDLRLGSIYQWARELAKGNHAAIGVCQADGHAEGVRYLTMEHVANAKTAKQAEADWILGIGRSHDDGMEYARFLNISKNKLMGDKDSLPEMRHGRIECLIIPEVARYEDIIRFN